MLLGQLWRKEAHEMTAERKTVESKLEAARARRSIRIHVFLSRWAERHWPERVTRFPKR